MDADPRSLKAQYPRQPVGQVDDGAPALHNELDDIDAQLPPRDAFHQ